MMGMLISTRTFTVAIDNQKFSDEVLEQTKKLDREMNGRPEGTPDTATFVAVGKLLKRIEELEKQMKGPDKADMVAIIDGVYIIRD